MKDTLEIINELLLELEKVPAADRSPYHGGVIGGLQAARDNATWELARLAAQAPPNTPATGASAAAR